MIKYRLGCSKGHEFESWFASGAAYESQVRRKLISCPQCQSTDIDRAPMAPAVVTSRRKAKTAKPAPAQDAAAPFDAALMNDIRQLKKKLTENSEYVGKGFAEEARKIHYGEAEERAIYGEATAEDAQALSDEDIPFAVLPRLPEDNN